jgi:hypothetical protein
MTDTVEVRMNFNDPNELAERYTAVWMEPDGDRPDVFSGAGRRETPGGCVTWRWDGVSPDGEVLGAGLEFVILAADGRIATGYQFVE